MNRSLFVLFFLGGAIFGKSLALEGIGFFTKAYLFLTNRSSFSYRSIGWHEGKIIFSHVHLRNAFMQVHADRIYISLGSKHLEVESPQIVFDQLPIPCAENRWNRKNDWTFDIRLGQLTLGEVKNIQFSFEKFWPGQMGRLILEKGGSQVCIEAIYEGDELWIDTQMDQFDLCFLHEQIDLDGKIDGRIHLVLEQGRCKRGAAQLTVSEGRYGHAVSSVQGNIDWDGVIHPGFLFEGRCRLNLSDGQVVAKAGVLQHLNGECSFASGLGAKWSFHGVGSTQERQLPFSWNGKAFLQESRPKWIESKAFFGQAQCLFKGREQEDGYRWESQISKVGFAEAMLVQSILSLANEDIEYGEPLRGCLNMEGKAFFAHGGGGEWDLCIAANEILYRCGHGSLQCETATAHFCSNDPKAIFASRQGDASALQGEFSFLGLSLEAALPTGKSIAGEGWKAHGLIENGVLVSSFWEGKVEGYDAALTLSGIPQAFCMEISGKEGKGCVNGQLIDGRLKWEIKKGVMQNILFEGKGWMDLDSNDWSLQAKGGAGSGIGFYCPILEKKGEIIDFDFRMESPSWDLVRVCGRIDGSQYFIDEARTHFLGQPVQVDMCEWRLDELEMLQLHTIITPMALQAVAPFVLPGIKNWNIPISGAADLGLSFHRNQGFSIEIEGKNFAWDNNSLEFQCSVQGQNGTWRISNARINDCTFSAALQKNGSTVQIMEGKGFWENGLEVDFDGFIDTSLNCAFQIPFVQLNLGKIHPLVFPIANPFERLNGYLQGNGCFSWRGALEIDFDLIAKDLKASSLSIENQGPIHLSYSSEKGVLCSGLDLHSLTTDIHLKIDLLQYDAIRSLWTLTHSRVHLPSDFLDFFPQRPEILKRLGQEVDFMADLECPSDFSYLSCYMKEGVIPIAGSLRTIRDFVFFFDATKAHLQFEYVHLDRTMRIDARTVLGQNFSGRIILQDVDAHTEEGGSPRPLTIDWAHSDERGFCIREIDGWFGGIEASFHAQDSEKSLIGSARIDFETLSPLLPSNLAQVFSDLKMKRGYELKGQLLLNEENVSFRGLLCGKQIDLCGYQLRTLLGKIELSPSRVYLHDLKISDSAGVMKIDQLVAEGVENAPWTISIPHLTILEFRPSLLQKEGHEPEPAGPLVVREFVIRDFKGLLEDSSTYTAVGEFSFINSYRRERTVFDIPSDLLGRIVGLDLELLIPVCGTLRYELKDRLVSLTEMKGAYSEANRSEFFLVPEPCPSVDLDGNLRICVNMKQFVLFKFTESFLIFIDGKLENPQFHLQKKRRFLDL